MKIGISIASDEHLFFYILSESVIFLYIMHFLSSSLISDRTFATVSLLKPRGSSLFVFRASHTIWHHPSICHFLTGNLHPHPTSPSLVNQTTSSSPFLYTDVTQRIKWPADGWGLVYKTILSLHWSL